MKTLVGTADENEYERYRVEYRRLIQNIRNVFENARRLR